VAGAEVDDWYALLTARTGDIRRSRETSARLAALDEPEILAAVASRMISENERSCWYIEPVCDRLPAESLRRLAGEAACARRRAALLRDFSGDGIQLASAVLLDYLAWPWYRWRQCLVRRMRGLRSRRE